MKKIIGLCLSLIASSSFSAELPDSNNIQELMSNLSKNKNDNRSFILKLPEAITGKEMSKIVNNYNLDVLSIEGKFSDGDREFTIVLKNFLGYEAPFNTKLNHLVKKFNRPSKANHKSKINYKIADKSISNDFSPGDLDIRWDKLTSSTSYKKINKLLSSDVQGTIVFTYKNQASKVRKSKNSPYRKSLPEKGESTTLKAKTSFEGMVKNDPIQAIPMRPPLISTDCGPGVPGEANCPPDHLFDPAVNHFYATLIKQNETEWTGFSEATFKFYMTSSLQAYFNSG